MGTVSGVARHCAAMGKPIFVLWIDAHGDYNTPVTSPTGNLHGMSLALLCNEPEFDGPFACDWRGSVDPRNVAIFGARSIDREERRLLEARGVLVVDMRKIDELGAVATMRTIIERVRKANGHLHVSLDVDAMDPSIAPGVGTTVPGGLTYREAHLAMEMLSRLRPRRLARHCRTQPLPRRSRQKRPASRGLGGQPLRPLHHEPARRRADGVRDRG